MTGGAVFLFGGALRLKARVPDLIRCLYNHTNRVVST